MARVRGTLISSRVPLPQVESMRTEPLRLTMLVFTTSMPTPRPEMSEIRTWWRNRGEDQVVGVVVAHARRAVGIQHAAADSDGFQLLRIHAGTVILDAKQDVILLGGAQG